MTQRKISPSSKLNPFSDRAVRVEDDSACNNGTKAGSTSHNKIDNISPAQGAAGQFLASLEPNDRRIANQFDSKCVLESAVVGSDHEKAELVLEERKWSENEARVGSTGVFLSERCWAEIARVLSTYPGDSVNNGDEMLHSTEYSNHKARVHSFEENFPTNASIHGDEAEYVGHFGSRDVEGRSDGNASAFNSGNMFKDLDTREQMVEKSKDRKMEEVDVLPVSSGRKRWLFILLEHFGKLKK
ncbi:hypothetical protein UA08_09144 [Talaromyces atroroseus]|uniref:Uncharacterized protein n=1 Tax=Talaromyces atroroseus TaxID=1441469 RepID=A0A1Q5Q6U2_TALAT|nr:hypothetical protein UA08_09144 [Talaromyces atroroseus]OKL55565.1 hypothetical protein UA08_09144 [Talaromyces atroroseus]